jgi:hypothetical protein
MLEIDVGEFVNLTLVTSIEIEKDGVTPHGYRAKFKMVGNSDATSKLFETPDAVRELLEKVRDGCSCPFNSFIDRNGFYY